MFSWPLPNNREYRKSDSYFGSSREMSTEWIASPSFIVSRASSLGGPPRNSTATLVPFAPKVDKSSLRRLADPVQPGPPQEHEVGVLQSERPFRRYRILLTTSP